MDKWDVVFIAVVVVGVLSLGFLFRGCTIEEGQIAAEKDRVRREQCAKLLANPDIPENSKILAAADMCR